MRRNAKDRGLTLFLIWSGNSAWWIIETVESYNGLHGPSDSNQAYIPLWFAQSAFGGSNYSNTPIGAVSHVDEPGLAGISDAYAYFGLWEAGKQFAICAWNSKQTPQFQAVGDPLVRK